MASDTLVVRESFVGRIKDEERLFRAGELIRANDPAVSKWPDKFGPAEFHHDAVEQATAAPGEKRDVSIASRVKAAAIGKPKTPKPAPVPEPSPRLATPAEEKVIAATIEAEGAPEGHAITTADIEP